jgi:hypothetical protein
MTATTSPPLAITPAQRNELRSRGLLAIPGALSHAEVECLETALDRIYADELSAGRLRLGDAMHLLGEIGRDAAFLELLDHPAVFPVVWGELGWNIQLYHCHLDVTPAGSGCREASHWGWHQDGGRLNLDLEVDPRPRMSLKVAYWLSDISEPERGNILVVPGSHERNTLARPDPAAAPLEAPAGAEPVLAAAGDALVFDRRLWHSRSPNRSEHTRKAIFLAYSFRWVRPRDSFGLDPGSARFRDLTPVRRQLLGETAGPRSHWGLEEEAVPLRSALTQRGLLDPANPSHR